MWDVASGELLRQLRVNEQEGVLAISPDGGQVVTASLDGVRVWDVPSGEELRQLRGYGYGVTSVAFSPDGCCVVTASSDGTARVWETLPSDLLVAKAKTRVTRQLTDAERAEFGLPADSRA